MVEQIWLWLCELNHAAKVQLFSRLLQIQFLYMSIEKIDKASFYIQFLYKSIEKIDSKNLLYLENNSYLCQVKKT